MEGTPQPDQKLRKSQRLIIIAIVGSLTVIDLLLFTYFPREPSVQGRSLSQWLEALNTPTNRSHFKEARAAILTIGTNALPYLVHNVTHIEPRWKTKLLKSARQNSFSKRFLPRPDRLKAPSFYSLLTLGTNSIPALEKACGSKNLRIRAEAAINLAYLVSNYWIICGHETDDAGDIGLFVSYKPDDQPIPYLIQHLKHTNILVRQASTDALSLFYTGNQAVREALDAGVREKSADR